MALDADQRMKMELILEGSKESPELLTDWETGFVSSFQERYETYGDDMFVSEKQWAILDRIYDTIVGV